MVWNRIWFALQSLFGIVDPADGQSGREDRGEESSDAGDSPRESWWFERRGDDW